MVLCLSRGGHGRRCVLVASCWKMSSVRQWRDIEYVLGGIMRQEEALLVIVNWLRNKRPNFGETLSHYGYDLYLPTLIRLLWHINHSTRPDQMQEARLVDQLFPIFADAA